MGDVGDSGGLIASAPSFNRRAIIAAVFNHAGDPLIGTKAYTDIRDYLSIAPDGFEAARHGAVVRTLAEFEPPWGGRELVLAALGPARVAVNWRLPEEIAEVAGRGSGIVLLTAMPASDEQVLIGACQAFGLNGLETRVAMGAVRAGDIQPIARIAQVSPNTAKEALAGAMRKVGVTRRAALVGRLSLVALGTVPKDSHPSWLSDAWGLTVRQAQIAGLIGNGISRGDVATALGLGQAVVRKELEAIYQTFGVTTAAGLARKLAESLAVRWLTEATAGDIGFDDEWSEPLSILRTKQGRRVSYSDYGPRSGRPTLVLHSASSNRPVSRALLRALHGAGRRVIAIDRPGFGLTDDFRRSREVRARMVAAVQDTLEVLDKLNIAQADIVSRHTPLAVRCHVLAPERFGVIVLVNPGLPAVVDKRRSGLSGFSKTIFEANPWAIRQTLRGVAAHMSIPRLARLLRTWIRDSPADRAAAENPELVRDYFRGVRMFGTGRVSGCVAEMIERIREGPIEPLPFYNEWRILVGSSDILYDPSEMTAFWRPRLPGATIREVRGAGRLLPYSHPEAIVEALES